MIYLTKCYECSGKGYVHVEEQLKEEEQYILGQNVRKCSTCRGTGILRQVNVISSPDEEILPKEERDLIAEKALVIMEAHKDPEMTEVVLALLIVHQLESLWQEAKKHAATK